MSLLAVREAQARLLGLASPLPAEPVPIAEAIGRHLAGAITARRDQPAADLSSMDGYAIRFDDMPGPWRVIGESAAGRGLDRPVAHGEAARIFTGAPMPAGADTIVIQEEASRDGAHLALAGEGPSIRGSSVRRRGSDFTNEAVLLEPGALLSPARLALAAIGGHGMLDVHRRPRVVILSTGDELTPPGAPLDDAKLPASNGLMLAAMLAPTPASVQDRGIVPDRLESLTAAFADAARSADVIVTTGGVSVGDHDLVRPALLAAGARIDFWRVAMRPGKPLMAGILGETIVLGLPGNPVSAFVTAHLFLLPFIRHLAGDPVPLPRTTTGPLTAPIAATGPRADYLRARLTAEGIAPMPSRDSALLGELARADALIVRPPHAPAALAGERCEILPLA